MTNSEAQAYAVVALSNLIKAGVVKVKNERSVLDKLDSEMYYLMDRYDEYEIVEKMEKVIMSNDSA